MRLRRDLLMLMPPKGYDEWAVTLTVPGPVVKPETYKAMFHTFSVYAQRKGWAGIWRAEVQARGALHWHVVLHLPPGSESEDVADLWHRVLSSSGPVGILRKPDEFDPCPDREDPTNWDIYDSRLECPGAVRYSAKVDASDGSERWWRYLCDHTSKNKQDQIGEGIGRHWGKIGRSLYTVQHPDVQHVSDDVFNRIVRALQRLTTTAHKEPKAPFGRKLGQRMKRGHAGRSVWFTSPEVVKRLIVHFSREEEEATRHATRWGKPISPRELRFARHRALLADRAAALFAGLPYPTEPF